MAKYYLYMLFAVFILLNGVNYFEDELHKTIKKDTLLKYKLEKQKLYATHSSEVEEILKSQKSIFMTNAKLFFEKKEKETIIFAEIQSYLQGISKSIDGKITQLQSGSVIDFKYYRKYPISLDIRLIPEDIDVFLKKLQLNKKYLLIESLYLVGIQRERAIRLKITLIGYQLK